MDELWKELLMVHTDISVLLHNLQNAKEQFTGEDVYNCREALLKENIFIAIARIKTVINIYDNEFKRKQVNIIAHQIEEASETNRNLVARKRNESPTSTNQCLSETENSVAKELMENINAFTSNVTERSIGRNVNLEQNIKLNRVGNSRHVESTVNTCITVSKDTYSNSINDLQSRNKPETDENNINKDNNVEAITEDIVDLSNTTDSISNFPSYTMTRDPHRKGERKIETKGIENRRSESKAEDTIQIEDTDDERNTLQTDTVAKNETTKQNVKRIKGHKRKLKNASNISEYNSDGLSSEAGEIEKDNSKSTEGWEDSLVTYLLSSTEPDHRRPNKNLAELETGKHGGQRSGNTPKRKRQKLKKASN